ncbi:hypothetical protein [Microbacterium sp. 77mftsu3.1]|uniref:hypothetical protein n=1 Tax=Microbacterium sp. 77mftsu3.1 TaxID=1761802 RepID=UPI000370D520|nr:hypothetical protein [Microbacterium sp. 77mftsu3.1]SDH56094.1 hypothetical protein SAMN04488590_3580 [Microbacterium sp. 77mftsu3.1]
MANPFLVLGGIAVGIITAAFGVLAVPGWVAAAQDASATNDLASIAIAQSATSSKLGTYALLTDLRSGWVKGEGTGVRITTAAPAIHVASNTKGDVWAAVAVSDSGHVLVRTSASPNILRGATPLAAAASTPITGAVVPAGLPTGVTLSGTRAVPTISVEGMGGGYMAENVIVDPSFLDPSRWELAAGYVIVPEGAHGDGNSLRVDASTAPSRLVTPATRTGKYTPVKPGERWQVTGLSKTTPDWNGTTGWSKLRVHYNVSTFIEAAVVVRSDNDWRRISASFTIPAGVTEISMAIAADHTAGTIWWDDIRLEKIGG